MADADVGSLGQETLKLLRAIATESQAGGDDSDGHASGAGGSSSAHVCTTTWCPVCQVVGFVKENPEVVDEIGTAAMQLARTVRHAFDAAMAPRDDGSSS